MLSFCDLQYKNDLNLCLKSYLKHNQDEKKSNIFWTISEKMATVHQLEAWFSIWLWKTFLMIIWGLFGQKMRVASDVAQAIFHTMDWNYLWRNIFISCSTDANKSWINESWFFKTVWILLHNKKNQRNCWNLIFTSYHLKIDLILYILIQKRYFQEDSLGFVWVFFSYKQNWIYIFIRQFFGFFVNYG